MIQNIDLIAYCGIDCSTCALYKATTEDSNEQRLAVKADWESKYEGLLLTLEDMNCMGCKSDLVYKYCSSCTFKTCNQEKGTALCTECSDYACDRINQFYAHQENNHSSIKVNRR